MTLSAAGGTTLLRRWCGISGGRTSSRGGGFLVARPNIPVSVAEVLCAAVPTFSVSSLPLKGVLLPPSNNVAVSAPRIACSVGKGGLCFATAQASRPIESWTSYLSWSDLVSKFTFGTTSQYHWRPDFAFTSSTIPVPLILEEFEYEDDRAVVAGDDNDGNVEEGAWGALWRMSSTLKKRKTKMNKHKLRKRRKRERLKSKRS